MKKYDGWAIKIPTGKLLAWSYSGTRRDIIYDKVGKILWLEWREKGARLVKVKLVEVEE